MDPRKTSGRSISIKYKFQQQQQQQTHTTRAHLNNRQRTISVTHCELWQMKRRQSSDYVMATKSSAGDIKEYRFNLKLIFNGVIVSQATFY
jgi:hypothetical protein